MFMRMAWSYSSSSVLLGGCWVPMIISVSFYHYTDLCDRLLETLLPYRPNAIAVDPRAFLLPSDSVR